MLSKIIINKLFESEDNSHYDYSQLVERDIGRIIFPNKVECISEGYAPGWDFKLKNGKTVELKVQAGSQLFLELAQKNSDNVYVDSGFTISKADYWIFINGGAVKNNISGEYDKIGKIRIIKRADLEQYVNSNKGQNQMDEYYNRTIAIKIKPKEIEHLWLANLNVDVNDVGVITSFHLTGIKHSNQSKELKKFIEE